MARPPIMTRGPVACAGRSIGAAGFGGFFCATD
jgi:hypothetical protein